MLGGNGRAFRTMPGTARGDVGRAPVLDARPTGRPRYPSRTLHVCRRRRLAEGRLPGDAVHPNLRAAREHAPERQQEPAQRHLRHSGLHRYLFGDRSEERKILLVWARAIVTEGEVGGSISQFCQARDMQRRTFDRRRVRACEKIAAEKNRIDGRG